MSDGIRVRGSSPEDLARGIPGIPPEQVITVMFRHPVTGADLPVKISAFQCQQGAGYFGIGVYMTGPDGDLTRGTVLRWATWNGPPDGDPAITYWEAGDHADDGPGHRAGRPGGGRGRRH